MQEVLSITREQTEIIIGLRPFVSWGALEAALRTTRGVSTSLITRYEEMMEGYRAVDRLINACQTMSRRARPMASQLSTPLPLPSLLAPGIELKSYQIAGVRWLLSLVDNGFGGGILADEMGLGKTAQVISFLAELTKCGKPGPHLIVVPSSTLDNWLREFGKFCPSLRVTSYYGNQAERADLRYNLSEEQDEPFNAIITTYNLATGSKDDRMFLRRFGFSSVILDEGHMVKNFGSARYKHLMSIRTSFRLLLTGTPLQNNLQELLALLTFVMPNELLQDEEAVRRVFRSAPASGSALISNQRVARAKRMMEPFILRRRKIEVLKELPKKMRRQIRCPMTPSQRRLYATMNRASRRQLRGGSANSKQFNNVIMQLRKVACHPMLHRALYTDDKIAKMAKDIMRASDRYCDAEYQYILEDMSVMNDIELHDLCIEFKSIFKYRLRNKEWMQAGKVKQLCEILEDAKKTGERVLVFSQFTQMLNILEPVMQTLGVRYLRLDGSTKVETRQELLDEFAADSSISVFLLSTKAGGFGLNMTAASIVVLYDPDFNPHNDRQAEDRAHRVGQTRDVTVLKLIAEGTIEVTKPCLLPCTPSE
ncbi:SNF2 family N-terminal domain-containing protein [Thamnocephalis sphaerospora]|uniref:SNF2 family N-terminal domain-containing protein n=1 Tax=Thamnocephalis sphaerospora TaxID=78915 RepID=A0A4P9XIH2_9FUNG|nr:SNF2 family N-terminal domain-containing protein [Thamnocephalis sphaerospora]|eukprot:RKP05494.1 SNF2 family N-terminal domain-containing protein [Thamnocephalis sphaerospora]